MTPGGLDWLPGQTAKRWQTGRNSRRRGGNTVQPAGVDPDIVRLLLGFVFLSSIGSSIAAADPALPAHYAPLFERGKTWVYDTALKEFGDPRPIVTRAKVTCTVGEVTKRGAAMVSHITCDRDPSPKLELPGYWVGTAAGLWHLGDEAPDADAIAQIQSEPPRIAGKPMAFETARKVELFDPAHDKIITGVRVSPKIHGWCAYEDSSNADPDGGRIVTCYGPGIGIQSGYNDVGGSLNKLEYTVTSDSSRARP